LTTHEEQAADQIPKERASATEQIFPIAIGYFAIGHHQLKGGFSFSLPKLLKFLTLPAGFNFYKL
jgi:hypothetical protein